MSEEKTCGQCGASLSAGAPEGLCPACLLKRGFQTQTAADPARDFTPPSPEELARYFPQLEILELLGRGGMGVVYKARQRDLDRLVALKILPSAGDRDPAFAERFAREARALARLSHPGIVAVYESGQAGGLYYFVMEYVDGLNLRQLLASAKMTSREALAIVPQICEALQTAHDQGIVHRDIKPENILLDKKGRVKIADFGIAKIVGGEERDMTLTGAGEMVGTPAYMAPEQIEHPGEVDHRADIYSLGVVFYQMLTGELPLGKFAPPSRKVQIDVRLDEVVMRALEKEPELRYQQASEVKTRVETISGTREGVASLQRGTAAPFASGRKGRIPAIAGAILQLGFPFGMLVLVLGFFGVHAVSVSQDSAVQGSTTTGNPFFLILIILLPLVGAVIGLVLLSVSLTAFRYREKWLFWFLAIYSWPLLFFFPIGTGFGLFFLIYCLSRREEFLGGATVRTEAAEKVKTRVETIVSSPRPGDGSGSPAPAERSITPEGLDQLRWKLIVSSAPLTIAAIAAGYYLAVYVQEGAGIAMGAWGVLFCGAITVLAATGRGNFERIKAAAQLTVVDSVGIVAVVMWLAWNTTDMLPPWRVCLVLLFGYMIVSGCLKLACVWPYGRGLWAADSREKQPMGYAALYFACLSGLIPTLFYWLRPLTAPWLSAEGQNLMIWAALWASICAVVLGLGARRSRVGRYAIVVGSINVTVWMLFFVAGQVSSLGAGAGAHPELLQDETTDIQPDGTAHYAVTSSVVNASSSPVYRDDFNSSSNYNLEKLADANGLPMHFQKTTGAGDLYHYSVTLNEPVPPGGRITETTEGTAIGLVRPMRAPGEFQYSFDHSPGYNGITRRIETHRLPPGAELIDKSPGDLTVKNVGNHIELHIDREIPAGGDLNVCFHYRLAKAPYASQAAVSGTGQASASTPGETSTPDDALKKRGVELIDLLVAGKFADADARFDPVMKAAMPAATLAKVWTQVGAGGKFLGRDAPHVDQEAGYACVYVPCRWERSQYDLKLVFDADGQLGGMWVVPYGK